VDIDKQSNQADEARETRYVPFDEFLTDAAALFDEAASGTKVTVERDGQLFRLAPVRRRSRRAHRFSSDDALWDIAGIARTNGPGDVATNKHKYLAEAYADLHEQRSPVAPLETPPSTSSPDHS
jgi:hypothetical protein